MANYNLMDPLLPSTTSFEDFLNNPLPDPPSFQFDEYKPETAVQPKKKRKRNDEAPSLTFCPLQKESWPTIQNEQGLNTLVQTKIFTKILLIFF